MSDTHQALYEGLRKQDPHALERLIVEFSSQVLHLATMILGKVGSKEDAEEVTSDVLAIVWQKIGEYDPTRSSFRSWVLMLTKYTALERRRWLLRRSYTPDGEPKVIPITSIQEPETEEQIEEAVMRKDERNHLYLALAQLSEQDRNLIIRRYFFEESVSQMAAEAGLTRNAMDNRLWRARQALKKRMHDTHEVKRDADKAL